VDREAAQDALAHPRFHGGWRAPYQPIGGSVDCYTERMNGQTHDYEVQCACGNR
jgi:hypothetical protein